LALTLLDPIVDALTYLHQQEPPILHRDIKPANIVVPLDGSIAALVDFGTAKEALPENTTTMFRHGTPGYAALEQYSSAGITDVRTDVYGLGATLYTLLTGVKPDDAVKRVTTEKGGRALQPVHVLAPDIPRPVSRAISRALSLHYVDRFATVEDFWHALHSDAGEQEEEPVLQTPGTGELRETRSGRGKRVALFSLVLLVLLALIGGGLGLQFSSMHFATSAPVIEHSSAQRPVPPSTSPSAVIFLYPPIASAYVGTISDIAVAKKTTKLYLGQVRQERNNIGGNFQGLGQVGSFTGIVNSSGSVRFIVKYGTGSLIFDGDIKVGGDIGGTFYAVDAQGQNIGEYGPWYASATSS
jgi:eukaryotic-like serine/threonine-protein kinase